MRFGKASVWVLLFASVLSIGLILPGDADAQRERKKKEKPAKEEPPPEPSVLVVPFGEVSKPVQFQKIAVRIPRNSNIGQFSGGLFCTKIWGGEPITYRGGLLGLERGDYNDVFRGELEAANYQVVGDPDALFVDPTSMKAEFLIGGVIKDLKVDLCYPGLDIDEQEGRARPISEYKSSGTATMTVEWQVFSRLKRAVVFQVTTTGFAKTKSSKYGADEEVVLDSFGAAARRLLSQQDFYNLLTGQSAGTISASAADLTLPALMPIKRLALSQRDFKDQVQDIRGQVATMFAGDGSGSGFYIAERYLLTNQHVVGGAKFVKVKFITGREILGEVVATHAERDVALVQTEPAGVNGLPLQTADHGIGAAVYIVGSPLGEENEGTVSSGIVSAYRVEEGQRYIQSDVNVMPGNSGGPILDDKGNVIGLTVSGRLDPMSGGMAGLNFFVPIAEALEKLNLQLQP